MYIQNGIPTERVKVALKRKEDWSDAFGKAPTIDEIKKKIATSHHLLDMPSDYSLTKTGYDVTQMHGNLLAQIKWFWQHTTYTINPQKSG